jgi:hypothetical protein
MNAIMVPSVVAIRNGGLFSSGNGVFDVIVNSSAGNDTQSRKKFIGKAGFGQRLGFTAGEADEDRAEIRHGEIKNIDHFRAMIVAACGAAPGRRKG